VVEWNGVKKGTSIHTLRRHRLRDLGIIALSVYVALLLEQTGALDRWIESASDFTILGSFLAGIFFTSLFTFAPAAVALGELMLHNSILSVAIPAAFGSLIGDLILFTFVRNAVSEDLRDLIDGAWMKVFKRVFRHPLLHWLVPLVGAIIIASPLPDEIGIAMLGLSKTRMRVLVPISLAMNFLGVVLVGIAARSL